MTPQEAQRQIDHASNRVSELEGELRAAWRTLSGTVDRVGLVVLGLSHVDVIRYGGKRYSVTGARYRYGEIEPRGIMIKKDGTIGERELSSYCRGWERENAD